MRLPWGIPVDVNDHGLFFVNSRLAFDEVNDGTAYTICIGEITRNCQAGWCVGNWTTLRNTGTPLNDVNIKEHAVLQVADSTGKTTSIILGTTTDSGFASDHVSGGNFLLADGQVKFVSQFIYMGLYQRLGHRSDGNLVGEF